MAVASIMTSIFLALLIAMAVGGILLQIFLSRMEKPWPGLILPGITFVLSLLPLLQVAAVGDPWTVTRVILVMILMGNIPTLVLLAIWLGFRRGKKRRRQLEKMNIQDLE